MTKPYVDRFNDANMDYTQAFLNVMNRRDPKDVKIFDESGFTLPDVCNPRYGHSPVGEPAVEIERNRQTPNVSLNLLLGAEGVAYANILDGASNTDTYLDFWDEAWNASTNEGAPALQPGDSVVVDNCPIHHNRAERILSVVLGNNGVEYIFTLTYSPDLNPVELCFQRLKQLFKTPLYRARQKTISDMLHGLNAITPAVLSTTQSVVI
jgi:hypothetical protein